MTQQPGAQIRVPRVVPHTRRVAGQFPAGLDLARFGVPSDLIASADRIALVNLACTAEAFADAGLEPEELLASVHPAQVANTQGAGMGGMASLRRLLLDHLLAEQRQNDRIQESLGNVFAAHAVQTYVGSYGPMIHPVGACATAAVSLEVAYDKIRSGGALAVLAGGFDDLTPEGMLGFADMGATASAEDLDAMGLAPHEASRANDVRRAGFVEAQGGGAQLVVRGDVALALGLPVRGVLAYAGSFADGLHTSIPAAGLGALAGARPLGEALARHGLSADDVAVVSKHDTSTEMNDPAEADLHERIQRALGRTPGNPLLVVSQKTITGHAKGGAAAWQLDGVLRMLDGGVVPGNRNLESVDPLERGNASLTLGDRPIAARRADPGRADHLARLRARLGAARRRAPRHVPGRRPRGRPRGLSAPRRPPPGRRRPAPPRGPHRAAADRAPQRRAAARPRRRGRSARRPPVIGVDLVDVPGFAEQLSDAASGFVDGTFTALEQRAAKGDVRRLAARFAAKEAFLKAWSGSRWGRPPLLIAVDLREIEVVDDDYGRPGIRLHGDVARAAGDVHAQVSLSHDGPAAIAVVLLAAR